MLKKSVIYFALVVTSIFFSHFVHASPKTKGIYINQGTLENTKRLNYLIAESKAVGINTFVVDLEKVTPNYKKNIDLIKDSGLHYVARVVVFPDGAKGASQLKSQEHIDKRMKLLNTAIDMGAEEVQLDYIRYSSKQPKSPQNAHDVKEVIQQFKKQAAARNIPLQIDIFGEVSFKESSHIGQNIQVFADTIDAACPMVYPSHYHPYQKHSKQPYQTVYNSLEALKKQFEANKPLPFRLNPYIEASNYHYKMSAQQKAVYVMSQIRAVEDANADGWFIWSPKNHYDHVFTALKNRHNLADKSAIKAEQPAEKKVVP